MNVISNTHNEISISLSTIDKMSSLLDQNMPVKNSQIPTLPPSAPGVPAGPRAPAGPCWPRAPAGPGLPRSP